MKNNNDKVVQFSQLDNNNKTQFLQFLLKNNIVFKQGDQNFIATVSIKQPIKDKIMLKQKNINNNINISKQKNINEKQLIKTNKDINKDKQQTFLKNNITSHKINQKKSVSPRQLRQFTHSPDKVQKENTVFPNSIKIASKNQNSHRNNNNQNHINKTISNYDNNQKIAKTPQKRITQNHNYHSKTVKIEKTKKQLNCSSRNQRKQKQINHIQLIEKNKLKQIDKYLQIFNIKQNSQRPVRWPLSQLEKYIEEIFTQNFIKNTQILHHKQDKYASMLSKNNQTNQFLKFIEKYFQKKYKLQKLIKSNIINMLYSLSYYLQRDNPSLLLVIFQRFLIKIYQYQDLVFFLFVRNMAQKQLNINFIGYYDKITNKIQSKLILKLKDINRLLKCIIGSDSQLINQYKQMILGQLNKYQSNNNGIDLYKLMIVLIQDYKNKRITQIEINQNSINIQENQDKSLQQLTFGQDQQISRQDRHFWHVELDQQQNQLEELQLIIAQKLNKKVSQFIEIIGWEQQENLKQRLNVLLFNKSKKLLSHIFKMNKILWFRQLCIIEPQQQDIEYIQHLQLMMRNLKRSPTSKDIGELCKYILTTKQITKQLQKFLL